MDEWAEEESSNVAVSISATMKSHGPQKRSFHLSVCLSSLISGHTVLSDERVNTSRVAGASATAFDQRWFNFVILLADERINSAL